MSGILDYFDLSKHNASTYIELPADIDSSERSFAGRRGTPKPAKTVPVWKQLILYLGTVIGILFSSAIMEFQAGKLGALQISLTAIILSAIIGLVIMPTVYRSAVKHDAPFIVQFGLFVQQGVFWSVLLTAIAKTLG